MKTFLKKSGVLVLTLLMLITSIPMMNFAGVDLGFTAKAATISSYKTGDIIEFGWYPQSRVTNASIISALNSANGKWVSYNYYSGTGDYSDGKMTASDYMRYKDVIYGSYKYRGVVFDSYRPAYTGSASSICYDNRYKAKTVYWFKYEPIKWRVLDPSTGMVMSESILDSQPYNNYVLSSGIDEYGYEAHWGDSSKTYYANNYAKSSIRQWLNKDFYNTAFSKAQQDIIKSTYLDNSSAHPSCSAYNSAATKDKIYLLSYDDTLNTSYGFSSSGYDCDIARCAKGSDYAQSQGLWVCNFSGSSYYGNSNWLLRSSSEESYVCCYVIEDGNSAYYCGVHSVDNGVRPALNFNLNSVIFQSDVKDSKIGSITLSKTKYIYDGKNKTPKLTVKDANGKVLTKNVDYKITVASKRSAIGRHTVKVTFIGNYSGSKNLYFYILPGAPATVKSSSQGTTSNKLTWSSVPGAAGYTLYYYSNSKKAYKKINTTTNTSYTVKGLLTGTKYNFKVVAYGTTAAGKVYDSETYTLLKSATKTKTPELTKVTASSTKGKAYVYHTDVKGETGYTVYYSNLNTTGFKKYANFGADTTMATITGLTSGKTYYFKIRTYIKTDSGYVYSPWSTVKGVKVK